MNNPLANWSFDATQVAPQSGFSPIKPGHYNSMITKIEAKPTNDGSGGKIEITHTIFGGEFDGRTVMDNCNLFNASDKAREIAAGQLSAICHVTGVMKLGNAAELDRLKGIPMGIHMRLQKFDEKRTQLKEGQTQADWEKIGFTEVGSYTDKNGQPPSKNGPSTTAPANTQTQPAPAATNAAWGATPAAEPAAATGGNAAWSGGGAAPAADAGSQWGGSGAPAATGNNPWG